jgi:hypothetical protein
LSALLVLIQLKKDSCTLTDLQQVWRAADNNIQCQSLILKIAGHAVMTHSTEVCQLLTSALSRCDYLMEEILFVWQEAAKLQLVDSLYLKMWHLLPQQELAWSVLSSYAQASSPELLHQTPMPLLMPTQMSSISAWLSMLEALDILALATQGHIAPASIRPCLPQHGAVQARALALAFRLPTLPEATSQVFAAVLHQLDDWLSGELLRAVVSGYFRCLKSLPSIQTVNIVGNFCLLIMDAPIHPRDQRTRDFPLKDAARGFIQSAIKQYGQNSLDSALLELL